MPLFMIVSYTPKKLFKPVWKCCPICDRSVLDLSKFVFLVHKLLIGANISDIHAQYHKPFIGS